VGASLARLGSFTGYRVTLIDDRAEFLNRTFFPEETIELIVAVTWYDACVRLLATAVAFP